MSETNAPDPTDSTQIVFPAESTDDIDAFLNSLGADFEYAPTVTVPPIAAQAPYGVDEHGNDIEESDEEVTPEGDTPEFVVINGQQVPLAEVQRLVDFDTYLKANPDTARRMAESIAAPTGLPPVPTATEPEARPVAEFTPPTPPETLDLEDPSIKFMWDELVATRKQAWEATQMSQAVAQQGQVTQQQLTARQAEIDMRDAQAQFRHDHPNMTEDNIKSIRKLAAEMNIVPGLLTSMPTPTEALHRAMEIAAWADADTRPLMLDTSSTPSPTATTTRKKRLSQISSAPGSAPVSDAPTRVRSDKDMIQAFATELAESGFGR